VIAIPDLRRNVLQVAVVVLLIVLVGVEIHGIRSANLFSQDIWTQIGLDRLGHYSAFFFGVAVPVLLLTPRWSAAIAITVAVVLTSIAVGPRAWLTALFVWMSAEALGARILRRAEVPSLEMRLVSALLGFAVYVFAMAFVVRLRVNFAWVYASILIVPVLANIGRFRQRVRSWAWVIVRPAVPSWPERAALALVLYVLGLSWLLVLKPEISADGLAMHLAIPAGIAAHHVMPFEPSRFVWAVMPIGADYSYTIAYLLGGEAASRLINFEMFLATVSLFWCAIRRWVDRPTAMVFAACLAATPLTSMVTGSLFVENQQSALIFAMVLSIWRLDETRDRRWLYVAAALGGTAVATKLGSNSFIACALPFAVIAVRTNWKSMGGRPVLASLAAVGLLLIFACPPYLIAWWKTGNPLFPFMNATFHSQFFPQMDFRDLSLHESLGFGSLYGLTFETTKWLAAQRGAFGFQYLIFVALTLATSLVIKQQRVLCAAAVGIGGAFLILRSVPNARYVYAAFPLVSVPPAALLHRLGSNTWVSRVLGTCVLACTGLDVYFFAASSYWDKDFYVPFSGGARSEYVRTTAPIRDVIDYLNKTHPGEAALFTHVTSVAGFVAEAYEVQWHQWLVWDQVKAAPDIPAMRSLLENWRVRYVIVPKDRGEFDSLPRVLGAFIENCTTSQFGALDIYAAKIEPTCTVPRADASLGAAAAGMGISGTLALTPVQLCESNGVGSVVVSWTLSGANQAEVHVGSPDGPLFTLASGEGSAKTPNWVSKGAYFYLQLATPGVPRTLDYTLARAVAKEAVSVACP
jgi:hypothetical protein